MLMWRGLLPLGVALAVGGAVTFAWSVLRDHETRHHADLLERESYATRSHLAREMTGQLEALREVAGYWSDYGHLAPDQWDQDAQIELSHFHGFATVLWSDPARDIRYATTKEEGLALDRRPDEAHWRELAPLVEDVPRTGAAAVLGPELAEDGHVGYRVVVPGKGAGSGAVMVAQVDAFDQLEQLLADRSPGIAINVFWEDRELYRRGLPASDVPQEWVREGLIELPMGPLWRVVHTPTEEQVDALSRPALPGLLVAGWAIAGLVGALVYQLGRVQDRASAAQLAEQRYAMLNRELEARVRERTEELAERTADLETIHESVAHDIRNPLNAIDLTTRLFRDRADDRQLAEAMQRIARANGQIEEVVERLNAYSTAAFLEVERQTMDMRSTVLDTVRNLAAAEPDARVEVVVDELPVCRAQPVLVEILWHNLIDNAIKYAGDSADPEIAVGAEPDTQPTVYFVRDNGPGFDAARAEDVFKPFVRLDGEKEGQGLGLAIVARVVRRHGGEIRAESSPGEGATFFFHLGEESRV